VRRDADCAAGPNLACPVPVIRAARDALAAFRSDAKFASRTGWPSFFQPASEAAVELRTDKGWLLRRTEVVCRRCGGHLGHVFRDGPRPTRRRYCINSCALSFEPTPPDRDPSDGPPGS